MSVESCLCSSLCRVSLAEEQRDLLFLGKSVSAPESRKCLNTNGNVVDSV